jgi:3-oxoacyl-[acyl-carrier-protein] synthase II
MQDHRFSNERIWITGLSAVTAVGSTLERTWDSLLSGRSGITPVRHFPTENYQSRYAACIPDLAPSDPAGAPSRIRALLQRLLAGGLPAISPDATLITATTKAGIDNLERLRRNSAADIDDILPSRVSSRIASALGLIDSGINISAACASSTIAVARGAGLIAGGLTDAVVVVCLDMVTEFVFSGFSALQALSPFPCKPFDKGRQGLTLGEGAAIIHLMRGDRAARRGFTHLGSLVGWGCSNDATHITAPARDGQGLISAIQKALKRAELDADRIDIVSAHGTGTIYNDAMELTAFNQVFGKHRPPAYSIKGAIGHTLGAAGGIEVAIGIQALQRGAAPPTVGLTEPDTGAEDWVSTEAKAAPGRCLLSTNSGFGGINAALILERGEA